jgi:hypothetical protein
MRLQHGDLRTAGLVLLVLAALLLSASAALAQAGYDLSWRTIAAGGGWQNGDYTLMAAAGQPLAGPLAGGVGYALCSGFWCGAAVSHHVYLPLVLRHESLR